MNPASTNTQNVSLESASPAVKPLEINGFTIDFQQGSATRTVASSDQSKQFKLVVSLKNLKDPQAIEKHLKPFTDDFCKKGADLCVKMGLGEKKPGKSHTLTRLSFNIDSKSKEIESITKDYDGRERKELKNVIQHYKDKDQLEKHKANESKVKSTQGKIQAFMEFNESLKKKAKKKEADQSIPRKPLAKDTSQVPVETDLPPPSSISESGSSLLDTPLPPPPTQFT